jgi:hypothetical protein
MLPNPPLHPTGRDAVIHAYCLTDNRHHLLVETPSGNRPQIMQHINGAYTTYFNVKRARAGHLFQGRYKAILVEMDEYAKELSGVYLFREHTGEKPRTIGAQFGLGDAAVEQSCKRSNPKLERTEN